MQRLDLRETSQMAAAGSYLTDGPKAAGNDLAGWALGRAEAGVRPEAR